MVVRRHAPRHRPRRAGIGLLVGLARDYGRLLARGRTAEVFSSVPALNATRVLVPPISATKNCGGVSDPIFRCSSGGLRRLIGRF